MSHWKCGDCAFTRHSYRYFVDSGNIITLLFFSGLAAPERFKPEKTAVDFSMCVKVPSQQNTGSAAFLIGAIILV